MKILHVVHGWFPESDGGVERYLRQLLPAQRQAGVAPMLLTGSMTPWEQCGLEREEVEGVTVVRLHRDDLFFDHHVKAWHPGVERLFDALLARERPDVVHVHQWIRLTANLVEVAVRRGCATVVTLHDVYTTCPRAFRVDRQGESCRRPLSVGSCLPCVPRYGHESERELAEGIALFAAHTRAELLGARALLVADDAVADEIARQLDVPRERFGVLPLPHAPRLPQRRPAAPPPAAGAALRIGYFGALAPHKGLRVLVDAFAGACGQAPARALELHLFGSAPVPAFADELRARARGLPVTFHGGYGSEELAAQELHVAVFPSLAFETYGLVLDEAFELGLPVVVSDVGALGRRAGAAGVRVPPGDVAALQTALLELAAEPERLRALAAHLPPPPPSIAQHVAALHAIYDAARAAPPRRDAPFVDPRRRAEFLVAQRESALRCITPVGGPS